MVTFKVLKHLMIGLSTENHKFHIPFSKFIKSPEHIYLSCVMRKPNILVSDLVRHKPGCTATEDGLRLENLDVESRRIVLSMQRKQRR